MRRTGSLAQTGIGLMIAAIVVGGVTLPVMQDSLVTNVNAVTNETHSSPTGSTPETLTLDQAPDGVVDGSVTVFFKDSFDGSVSQLNSSTFETLSDGTAEDLNMTGPIPDLNSTSDQYNVTYDGKPSGYIDNQLARTVVEYAPVGAALGLLVAAFGAFGLGA